MFDLDALTDGRIVDERQQRCAFHTDLAAHRSLEPGPVLHEPFVSVVLTQQSRVVHPGPTEIRVDLDARDGDHLQTVIVE